MNTVKLMSRHATLISAVAAALVISSATALAGDAACMDHAARAGAPASSTNSVTVNYRDLNLATTGGHRALEERITLAARKVCAAGDIRDLDAVAASDACQRAAVSQALSDVGSAHPAAQYAVNLSRG